MLVKNFFLSMACLSLGVNAVEKDVWIQKDSSYPGNEKSCTRLGLNFTGISGNSVHCEIPGEKLAFPKYDDLKKDFKLNVLGVRLEEHILSGENRDDKGKTVDAHGNYNGYKELSCRLPQYIMRLFKEMEVIPILGAHTAGCIEQLTMNDIFEYYGWYSAIPSSPMYDHLGMKLFSKVPVVSHKYVQFRNVSETAEDKEMFGFHVVTLKKHQHDAYVITANFDVSSDHSVANSQKKELSDYISDNFGNQKVIIHSNSALAQDENEDYNMLVSVNSQRSDEMVYYSYMSELRTNSYCADVNSLAEWKNHYDSDCERVVYTNDYSPYQATVGVFTYHFR